MTKVNKEGKNTTLTSYEPFPPMLLKVNTATPHLRTPVHHLVTVIHEGTQHNKQEGEMNVRMKTNNQIKLLHSWYIWKSL